MNNGNAPKQSQDFRLAPFQAEFVDSFFASESPPYHQLVAPFGMGKSTVLAAVVNKALSMDDYKHVLVLTPSALAAQSAESIQGTTPSHRVTLLDGVRFREMEADAPSGISPWLATRLVIAGDDFAKKPDVANSLANICWDLLVMDEAHRLAGGRRDLVQRLLREGKTRRLLFATGTPLPVEGLESLAPGVATTTWTGVELATAGANYYTPQQRFWEVVPYTLSNAELRVLDRLRELTEVDSSAKESVLLRKVFLRLASSSLYTLEHSLWRRLERQAFVTRALADIDEGDEGTFALGGLIQCQDSALLEELAPIEEEMVRIRSTIDTMECVTTDSKLEAFLQLLMHCAAPGSGNVLLVFSCYRSTLDYLGVAISDMGIPSYCVTGITPYKERKRALDAVEQGGGVLLASVAGLRDLDRLFASEAIAYDLPLRPEDMEGWWRLLKAAEPGGYRRMYAFRDTTGALSYEEEALKMHGICEDEKVADQAAVSTGARSDRHKVCELGQWTEVGSYIAGRARSVTWPTGSAPHVALVFALRAAGVTVDALRQALPRVEVDGDLLYLGYSENLGDHQTGRVYNFRKNEQPTNERVRGDVALILKIPGARVELGWKQVNSRKEAIEVCNKSKHSYRERHGHLPPLNRR